MRRTMLYLPVALAVAALCLVACKATTTSVHVAPTLAGTIQPTGVTTTPGGALPVPADTIANLCDVLDIATINQITGMSVRPPTGGSSDHCTWWNGTGFGQGGMTLTVKPTGYAGPAIDKAIASSLYKAVSGIGLKAAANDKTLPAPIGPHVLLIVDFGPYGITLSLTSANASIPQTVQLANDALPHI